MVPVFGEFVEDGPGEGDVIVDAQQLDRRDRVAVLHRAGHVTRLVNESMCE